MALNDTLLTWIAYARLTGQPVVVDDRTFNEDDHVSEWPLPSARDAAVEKPTKTVKKGKQV